MISDAKSPTKNTIEFAEWYDDNGETAGFAVQLNGMQGYGAIYPCENERHEEVMAGYFCDVYIEAPTMCDIRAQVARMPLVKLGDWVVEYQ